MSMNLPDYTLPAGKALVLRVIHADRSSSRGFVWPEVGGIAKAPDWDPEPVCGGGLHGWLWAQGSVNGSGADWGFTEAGAIWLVLEVNVADVVAIDGGQKVKFPEALVLFAGRASECSDFISKHLVGQIAQGLIAGTATVGYRGTATAGDSGTATAGDSGTAKAGHSGTATAGHRGTATAGTGGTATAGTGGTATAGTGGTRRRTSTCGWSGRSERTGCCRTSRTSSTTMARSCAPTGTTRSTRAFQLWQISSSVTANLE